MGKQQPVNGERMNKQEIKKGKKGGKLRFLHVALSRDSFCLIALPLAPFLFLSSENVASPSNQTTFFFVKSLKAKGF